MRPPAPRRLPATQQARTQSPGEKVYDLTTDPDQVVPHVEKKHGTPLDIQGLKAELMKRGFNAVRYSNHHPPERLDPSLGAHGVK